MTSTKEKEAAQPHGWEPFGPGRTHHRLKGNTMRTAEHIPTPRSANGAGNTTTSSAATGLATVERGDLDGLHGRLQRLLRLVHHLAQRVDDPADGLVAIQRHTDRQLDELHHRCDTLAARIDDLEGEHAATLRREEKAEADRNTYARLWARLHAELDKLRGSYRGVNT
jgi:chromosome segregation ATPase